MYVLLRDDKHNKFQLTLFQLTKKLPVTVTEAVLALATLGYATKVASTSYALHCPCLGIYQTLSAVVI